MFIIFKPDKIGWIVFVVKNRAILNLFSAKLQCLSHVGQRRIECNNTQMVKIGKYLVAKNNICDKISLLRVGY